MYTRQDFQKLNVVLKANLLHPENGYPLICNLYECDNAQGAATIEFADGSKMLHIAEACNVAAVVNSLSRLLTLPRSTIACEDLSEVMLLRLDVLREYVRDLLPVDRYEETASEKLIRWWAGFLKHPRGFVLAHRCIVEWGDLDGVLLLDTKKVEEFSKIPSNTLKDKAKDKFKNVPVKVVLPTVDEIEKFFEECGKKMKTTVEMYK